VKQNEGFETNGKVSVEFRERHLQPLVYPVVVLVWLRSVLVDNRKAYNIGNHYSVNLSLATLTIFTIEKIINFKSGRSNMKINGAKK
jgi:hypothetical protein